MSQDTDTTKGWWIDRARSVFLADVGQPDYGAAVVVRGDGTHLLALIQLRTPDAGWSWPSAEHERLGPLRPVWAARVQLAPLRCARTTLSGRPCRNTVSKAGQPCPKHRNHHQGGTP